LERCASELSEDLSAARAIRRSQYSPRNLVDPGFDDPVSS
jgi:hypothetical protein